MGAMVHNSSALGVEAARPMVCLHPTRSLARVAFGVRSMMAWRLRHDLV
jgi:hypothetical protein